MSMFGGLLVLQVRPSSCMLRHHGLLHVPVCRYRRVWCLPAPLPHAVDPTLLHAVLSDKSKESLPVTPTCCRHVWCIACHLHGLCQALFSSFHNTYSWRLPFVSSKAATTFVLAAPAPCNASIVMGDSTVPAVVHSLTHGRWHDDWLPL